MRPYIFGARNGIHIIDLQQTVKMFQKAHDFLVETTAKGGKVIFVGTKRQAQEIGQDRGGARRPVLRHPPLDGRHPDQLPDHQKEHRPPQGHRGHVRRRVHQEVPQKGNRGHDPRGHQAEQRPGRHQGHGKTSVRRLHHRPQAGAHRHSGMPQARHPGRGRDRHQLRPGPDRLHHPGQ